MTWTPEAVTTLLWMDAKGASLSDIANALGISRGAVAGQRFRLGLRKIEPQKPKLLTAKPERAPKKPKVLAAKSKVSTSSISQRLPWPPPELPIDPPQPTKDGVDFFDLEQEHCRWPIGHMRFCGAAREYGPYCEVHASKAYTTRTK